MIQLGMSKLEEFAKYVGVTHPTIHQMVMGRLTVSGSWVKPSIETLVKLAVALDKPLHELVYRLEPEAPGATDLNHLTPDQHRVPVVGYVGAGPGQNHAVEGEHVTVSSRFAAGKQLVAYRIKGNSMAGGKRPIHDNDIVIVDTLDPGHSGQIVVARLTDDWFVCKAYRDDQFGRLLTSMNPLYANSSPPIIPADQVAGIVGRVVRVISDMESLDA